MPTQNDVHLRCTPLDAINSIPNFQRSNPRELSFLEQPFLRASQLFRFTKKPRCRQKGPAHCHYLRPHPKVRTVSQFCSGIAKFSDSYIGRQPEIAAFFSATTSLEDKETVTPELHPCGCYQREKQKYIDRPLSLKG